ncbi:MAG: NifU-like domain protein [Acidobacteria bacterium ADurb.Bin340]|nr:MAG: NifU-like domain protein [Acidobacteria bacterium ADurb.Bin340]
MPKIAEIEYTPNPNAVKFVLRQPVAVGFPKSFPSREIAEADELAKALFEVGHVVSVFMQAVPTPAYDPDDAFLEQVRKVLSVQILPALAADGGGLEIVGRHEKQVMIRYMGACTTCPSGLTGTLVAIEGILKAEVDPEIVVIPV